MNILLGKLKANRGLRRTKPSCMVGWPDLDFEKDTRKEEWHILAHKSPGKRKALGQKSISWDQRGNRPSPEEGPGT